MFEQYTRRYLEAIDATMREIVASALNDEPGFGVMIRYAMGWSDIQDLPYTGITGKRLRPTLLLLSTEATGGHFEKALPGAAAVEMLHNFSLIHDDIQDSSDTRHGRPTVWKVWGVPNAINAGDALFTLSYIALEKLTEKLDASVALETWRIFNATNLELTRGQHLDMSFEKEHLVTTEAYISMIRGKSAALLAACAQIGALVGSGNIESSQHYATFGENMGIAFQIRDDILGIWGDPQKTGKSAATDIASRKKSLPVLYGLARSEELVHLYGKENLTVRDVQRAVTLLDDVGARDYTREKEQAYHQRAMNAISQIGQPDQQFEQLKQFTDLLFGRDY